ncbi:MAG TPA: hypothetical protein VIM15_00250 [Gemmatimonadaceae bacterium]
MTFKSALLEIAGLAIMASAVSAQSTTQSAPPPPLDGVARPLRDSVLEQLAGTWSTTRKSSRGTTVSIVQADWVLSHQFLRLHYSDTATPSSYEAMVFSATTTRGDRYVAHWIDVFGGRFSETLGYGSRVPGGIRFVFEYPDGPFVNAFSFDRSKNEWLSQMRQKNARGEWVSFADETFRRQ